jgi:hypothetical protein
MFRDLNSHPQVIIARSYHHSECCSHNHYNSICILHMHIECYMQWPEDGIINSETHRPWISKQIIRLLFVEGCNLISNLLPVPKIRSENLKGQSRKIVTSMNWWREKQNNWTDKSCSGLLAPASKVMRLINIHAGGSVCARASFPMRSWYEIQTEKWRQPQWRGEQQLHTSVRNSQICCPVRYKLLISHLTVTFW